MVGAAYGHPARSYANCLERWISPRIGDSACMAAALMADGISRRRVLQGAAAAGMAAWAVPTIDSLVSGSSAGSLVTRARSISSEPDSGVDYAGGSGHATFDFTDVAPFGSLAVGTGGGFYQVTIACVAFLGGGDVYVAGPVAPGSAFTGNYFYGRMTAGGPGVGAIYGQFTAPECYPTNPGDVGSAFVIDAGTISVTP
jgi:hypothetical protein